MIAALTAGSAVCCFGVAYASHMMLPVKPVTPAEILKNQSTLNTVNVLTFNELKDRPLQERINAYTSSRANLQDVMMATAERPTLNQSYVAIAKKIPTLPPESAERGQYEFLKKAADDHYTGFIPPPPPPPPTATTPPPPSRLLPEASSRELSFSPVHARSSARQTPRGGRHRRSSVSE